MERRDRFDQSGLGKYHGESRSRSQPRRRQAGHTRLPSLCLPQSPPAPAASGANIDEEARHVGTCSEPLALAFFPCGHVKFEHASDSTACTQRHGSHHYERVTKTDLCSSRCGRPACSTTPVDAQGMAIAVAELLNRFRELHQEQLSKRSELDSLHRSGNDVQLDLWIGQAQGALYKSESNLAICQSWITRARDHNLIPRDCEGFSKAYTIMLRTIKAIEGDLKLAADGLEAYKKDSTNETTSMQHRSTLAAPQSTQTAVASSTHSQQDSRNFYRNDAVTMGTTTRREEYEYGVSKGHFLDEEMDDDGYWTRATFGEVHEF